MALTYNGVFWDGSITYGGYSSMYVAHKRFVVRIPDSRIDAARCCATVGMYVATGVLPATKCSWVTRSPQQQHQISSLLMADPTLEEDC
ncbi:hypothetical protein ZWY2020_028908 [Hordeum vulgare]|nr:hypothetical protein ZWY2020_028908 [Hordeum vulgare]